MSITITPKGAGTASSTNLQPTTPLNPIIKAKISEKPGANPIFEKLRSKIVAAEKAGQPLNKFGEIIPPQPSGLSKEATPPQSVETKAPLPQVEAAEANSRALPPQYAALARKEQAFRKAQQELKTAQDAWQQKQAGFVSKESLQSDPLKALAEAGISYDKLVELQINQANPDPNAALLARISELETKLAGVDTNLQNRDKQSYDQAVNQIRNDAKLLVDSDPAFEVTKATGQSEEVVELIKKVFDAEGVILDVEDAARQVEEVLQERKAKEITTLQSLSSIKKRLEASKPVATEAQAAEQVAAPSPTTLNNNMSGVKPLSARERAILAFEAARKRTL
jgi:hypothetical protein